MFVINIISARCVTRTYAYTTRRYLFDRRRRRRRRSLLILNWYVFILYYNVHNNILLYTSRIQVRLAGYHSSYLLLCPVGGYGEKYQFIEKILWSFDRWLFILDLSIIYINYQRFSGCRAIYHHFTVTRYTYIIFHNNNITFRRNTIC